MKLRIYLADLTHIGLGIASEAFPLNIGLIASYAKKLFGKEIDISLFKDPMELLAALREAPPHILGCSNYTWNCNLSYYFTQLAKSLNPGVLTIWGGTNFPFEVIQQEKMLRRWSAIDIQVFYEGEQAFANILERMFSTMELRVALKDPIDGCRLLSISDGTFLSGTPLSRIKDLDSIPSPYATGLLDKFFDEAMVPLVETSRGCPFACNFCNAGNDYFNQVNKFSDDYIREELTYIARQSSKGGINQVTFADNNFGMMQRDVKTAELIFDLQQKFGWPQTLSMWTGKNSKQRVIDVTRLLGDSLNISMAVQSMDESVQKNIKRDNISLEDYHVIAEQLAEEGRPQYADLIMLLPGETLESQLKGFDELLDTRIDRMLAYNLSILYGTPYKDDDEFFKQYGYQTKFRLVVRNFSEIENERIFDVEEIAVASKDMSFDDYIQARQYLFIIDLCYNAGIFYPLQRYLIERGIKNSDWIRNLWQAKKYFPPSVVEVFESFERETIQELWDSEEALVAHYSDPENYLQLMNGKCGVNVLYAHRVRMFSEELELWVATIFKFSEELLAARSKNSSTQKMKSELESLRRFIMATAKNCYSIVELEKTLIEEISYDIPLWLDNKEKSWLENFISSKPISVMAYFADQDKQILCEDLTSFGSDINGIIKSLQRRGGKLPLRSVKYAEKLSAGTS